MKNVPFPHIVQEGHNTGSGAPRGLFDPGLPTPVAASVHLGPGRGDDLVMLHELDVALPLSDLLSKSAAVDVLHHAGQTVASGLAHSFLDRPKVRA